MDLQVHFPTNFLLNFSSLLFIISIFTMVSADFVSSVDITTSAERNVSIGILTVSTVNAFIALFLLVIISLKARRFSPLFFFNSTLLVFNIIQSAVTIALTLNILSSNINESLLLTQTSFTCLVKVLIELILILRLRTLLPDNYYLLAACTFFVILRAFLEFYSESLFVVYGTQSPSLWANLMEPFVEAFNIIAFSSIFIITLVSKMYVHRTMEAFRQHRLFFFLLLAIENMVVPCITAITLAVYSFYVSDPLTFGYRALILFIHLGVTVVSIIMTTVLGSTSKIRHHSYEKIDKPRVNRKDRQLRTLSMAAGVKVLTEAESEEAKSEFEFAYIGAERGSDC